MPFLHLEQLPLVHSRKVLDKYTYVHPSLGPFISKRNETRREEFEDLTE
jgi:hypothetical protein